LAFYWLGVQQAFADLAQGDRERLLLHSGLDHRSDVLKQALTELGVVRVDLPGSLGGHDYQAVLAVHGIQQLIDGRVDDSFERRRPSHSVLPNGSFTVDPAQWRPSPRAPITMGLSRQPDDPSPGRRGRDQGYQLIADIGDRRVNERDVEFLLCPQLGPGS